MASFDPTKRLTIGFDPASGTYYPAVVQKPTKWLAYFVQVIRSWWTKESAKVNSCMQQFLVTNTEFATNNNVKICQAVSHVVQHEGNGLSKIVQEQLTLQLRVWAVVEDIQQEKINALAQATM